MPFANKTPKPVIVEMPMEPPDTSLSHKEVEPETSALSTDYEWWDGGTIVHPLDDTQFVQVFCEYMILNSDDRSIRTQRNRLYRFIRNFMRQELERELSRYRSAHL